MAAILVFLIALNLLFVMTQTGVWPLNLVAAIYCAYTLFTSHVG